jgi:hypothetical protein
LRCFQLISYNSSLDVNNATRSLPTDTSTNTAVKLWGYSDQPLQVFIVYADNSSGDNSLSELYSFYANNHPPKRPLVSLLFLCGCTPSVCCARVCECQDVLAAHVVAREPSRASCCEQAEQKMEQRVQ